MDYTLIPVLIDEDTFTKYRARAKAAGYIDDNLPQDEGPSDEEAIGHWLKTIADLDCELPY